MFNLLRIGHTEVELKMFELLGDGLVASGARYHLEGGGSRTRAKLALEAAEALGLGENSALACACTSELLHNASLVHDDLQEGDEMRRGRPAVWRHYDAAAAICIGDLMISAAFASLANHPRAASAIALTHETVSKTARGQAEDLKGGRLSLVSYVWLAELKTGPLLALPVRLALCAAGEPGDADALEAGGKLAVAYQALDDIVDRDADRMAGRINICTLLEADGHAPAQATALARRRAREALDDARKLADCLPSHSGDAFASLADRLEDALMEISNVA